MSTPLRSLLACTFALLLPACGEDTSGDTGASEAEAGAEAETGTSTSDDTAAGVQTRGEGCELVGRTGCMRALTCNLTFTDLELCTSMAVDDCCEEAGTCGDAVAENVWEACADALESQACEEVGTIPVACEALALWD